MGFSKEDEYPLLMIDSSSKEMSAADQVGKENILSHLHQLKLIGPYKSFSAYEKVGLKFVEEDFEPVLDDIFRNFIPIINFYMAPKMFRHSKWDR